MMTIEEFVQKLKNGEKFAFDYVEQTFIDEVNALLAK